MSLTLAGERAEKHRVAQRKAERRYRKKVAANRPFVAYDGEGITLEDGSHLYTLLACSDGRYIENYEGLSTKECLRFLLESKLANPNGIHVIFGGTYDMNMMLRELPPRYLESLWKDGQTRWKDYRIKYRHRKEYMVADWDTCLTLYDVQTFFQCAFVSACDQYLGNWPEREQVVAGKAQRGYFTQEDRDTTRSYCFAELQVLVRLMNELRSRLHAVDLKPTRWNGPGAVATALLKREGIKEHMKPTEPERIEATRCAYFGGRFEMAKFGHYEGTVYEYDINSAYPSAMRDLPSLANGDWVHRGPTSRVPDTFSLYHITYEIPRLQSESTWLLGPAPSRSKDGSIAYPCSGSVWLWGIEAQGVKEWCKVRGGTFKVTEWWQFRDTGERPFRFVDTLYQQRRALKAAGDGAHVGIKLGLNSLYGKTAQQVGWKVDNFGKATLPPFHQLDYAGYITAACRAQIWQAYMLKPEAIIAIETDAIFSTEPLPLTIGSNLGEWELTTFSDLTYVQSGTYWATEDGEPVNKYRGFDKGTITRDMILGKWSGKEWWTGVQGMESRFGGMGEALHRNDWGAFCRWNTNPRMLSTDLTGKRSHIAPDCFVCNHYKGTGLRLGVWHETQCLKDFLNIESEPCSIEWLDEDISDYDREAAYARRANNDYD